MIDTTPEEKLLNLIKKDQSKTRIRKELKIFTKINILLIGIIAIVAVIFLADVFIFRQKTSEEMPVIDMQAKVPQVQPVANEPEEDSTPILTDKATDPKKISREEILGNLNLLGIITGENNQAIIEDKNLKKTFFLYKGDFLGELKVDDIKSNMVILEYKGEKIELSI
ncbi:MAG: hypothetical protein Q8N76_05065 [Candidatus Omnitrophota bacterium]|nr:hypothetical protein [Candidatus Omnitrophota bacterium]